MNAHTCTHKHKHACRHTYTWIFRQKCAHIYTHLNMDCSVKVATVLAVITVTGRTFN